MSNDAQSGGDPGDGSGEITEEPRENRDPIDVFEDANAEFQERISEIGDNERYEKSEKMRAAEEFLATIAAIDPNEMLIEQTAHIVKSNVDGFTKRSAKSQLRDLVDESKRGDAPELGELFRNHLTAIEKLAVDESETDPRFRFVFDDDRTLVVDSETYYSKTQFCKTYNTAFGEYPEFDGGDDDYRDLIREVQQDCLTVEPDSTGPRSQAIEKLRTKVAKSEAYLDARGAMQNNGVLIEADDPEAAEDADRVWIASDEIRRICDDKDIEPQSLRIEMDDRNLRAGRSEQKRYGNHRPYFWPLDADEFEPKLIETESDAEADSPDPSEG